MILPPHVPYFQEIFSIPGFLTDPILVFGHQDVWREGVKIENPPEMLRYPDLNEYLRSRGFQNVLTLDHFDPRSELHYDMNDPVPPHEHEQYSTFIDIGCIEHVFDTRQCLENCLRMVKVGGHYLMHAPIHGYYGHGLHTFHPEGLLTALELNGFDILYRKFSTNEGVPVIAPEKHSYVLLWAVAKKVKSFEKFVCPQQGRWSTKYLDKVRL